MSDKPIETPADLMKLSTDMALQVERERRNREAAFRLDQHKKQLAAKRQMRSFADSPLFNAQEGLF